MKSRIVVIALLLIACPVQISAMKEETSSNRLYSTLCTAYKSASSPEERANIFKEMRDCFAIAKAIKKIETTKAPNIVLWFTNYFGSITKESLTWYKKEVFTQLPRATFWLTDLKAWQPLSVGEAQLKKNNPALIATLKNRSLDEKECPLRGTSKVLTASSIAHLTAYRLLSSESFFKWLLENTDMSLVSDETIASLCIASPRSGALSASLSDLGYKPELLNRIVPKISSKNIIDLPSSQLLPLLQYLEGVCYASEIITKSGSESPVYFFLPNQECESYQVPGEPKPYDTFTKAVQKVLKIEDDIRVTFVPFAYGAHMNAAPFKDKGKRLSAAQCSHELAS